MDIGKSPCQQTLDVRRLLPHTWDTSSLETMQCTGHIREIDGPGSGGIAVVPLLGVFGRYYILWDHI